MQKTLTVIFLYLLFTGCAHKGPQAEDGPQAACPATPQWIRDNCGCHPYEERMYNLLYQSQLSEDVKVNARDCLSAGFSGDPVNPFIKDI